MAQVDTGIYQNLLRPVKSVQEYDAEAQQAEGNRLGLLLQRGQYDAQQRGVAEDNAFRNALSSGADDRALMAASPTRALAFQEGRAKIAKEQALTTKAASEAKKTDWESAVAKQAHIAQLASSATDQTSWTQARKIAEMLGADVSQVPEQFDPATAKHFGSMAMTQAQRLDQAHKEATLAETERDNKSKGVIAARNASAAEGQLSVARQRLTLDQQAPKGQIVQTDQGTMLVDPRTGNATPAMGPGGVPLTKPLKDIPANVNTAIITNSQNLNKVNQAIDLLSGKDVGALKGDKEATGWKGYAPQAILNRSDPKGVDTRAMISDIGSLILHDRSGAAITASESPRLMPFIPLATDDNKTALKKLTRFKQLYEQEQQAFADTYSKDQGYRPSPTKSAGGGPSKTANGATVSNW